jgi:hypothetical protein
LRRLDNRTRQLARRAGRAGLQPATQRDPAGAVYTYAVTSGSLPAGLSLTSAGLLGGKPTHAGVFNFRVTMTANWGSQSCAGSCDYQLTVATGSAALRADDEGVGAGNTRNKAAVNNDFDGDGKSDLVSWNGETGEWLIARSSDNQTEAVKWDAGYEPNSDAVVSGDYDGDGKADLAVFNRADARWFIRQSSDGATVEKQWGVGTDMPVAADYDGDGKADIAVWRGSEGVWYILHSSAGREQSISMDAPLAGDVPVLGDYDGDGKADLAVARASEGTWHIKCGSDTPVMSKTQR